MAFNKIQYKPGDVLTAEQMNDIQTEILLHQGLLSQIETETAMHAYDIDSKESFHNALIEQAEQMTPGATRLVYFREKVPTVFYNGYAVAKLYTVESREQETDIRVCVDIYTGSKWFMTVTKDEEGAWTCSDIVKVLTKVDYDELWNLIYDSNQYIKNHYYTSSETDQKFVPISSAGMCREFDSGTLNSYYYITSGNLSKFYTIELTDDSYSYSFTVDYRHLHQPDESVPGAAEFTSFYCVPVYNTANNQTKCARLEVGIRRNTDGTKQVFFNLSDLENDSRIKISHVCGYY